jgi:preprotein translocase subunit YajC
LLLSRVSAMDTLTISVSFVAILGSISFLTLNTLELLRRAKKSSSELESQLDEIQVVSEVLAECHGIVQASQNTKIPLSVERALRICERRYAELAECMKAVCDLRLGSKSKLVKSQR